MEGQENYLILPGRYNIAFHDSYEAISSNTIAIRLAFTTKSVDYLLERLNKAMLASNIIWAKMLLSDIYPDMNNYQFTKGDTAISYTLDQQKFNAQLLNGFKIYCNKNKDSKEMKARIHKINTNFSKYDFIDQRRTMPHNDCLQ